MKRLLFFLVIMLEGKSLQAQKTDSLMFESYFTKVEYLKYLPEKLDSSLFWTDKMIREAYTPYQMGLAQFAKGQLISMGNWSYNGGEYAVNYLVNAINIFAKINNREFLHKSLNVLISIILKTGVSPNAYITRIWL